MRTVIKGTTQNIAVDTNPQGANCSVSQDGAQVAIVNPTPGKVKVSRSKDALTFTCSKLPEFPNSAVVTLESTFNGATVGNVLIGGLIGVAVDASTGANYSYPENVMIDIAAANAPAPEAAPGPQSAPAPETPKGTAPATKQIAPPAPKPEPSAPVAAPSATSN